MPDHLRTGSRRALPMPPLLLADEQARRVALQRALSDPDQLWQLQEFDGWRFVDHGQGRGPQARIAYLDHSTTSDEDLERPRP